MSPHFRRLLQLPICLCAILCMGALAVQGDEEKLRDEKFFESHVRPLLLEKCMKCHGEEKQRGGLRLDSIAAILTGGESGESIVPHKPDESLLIEAVRYESYEMPPDGRLSQQEIDLLVRWVEMGAPWPGGARAVRPASDEPAISDEDREFWSFRPLDQVEVPQSGGGWARNGIDRFIHQKLDEKGLTPSDEADRIVLVRRLYLDLIGLPPSPDEIDAFLGDGSPTAYEDLADKLLASERYGERWASFWLDLVRYAESDGFRKDDYRPEAWRYRDYVVGAFNDDKPFNEFVSEQIAGDEIAPEDPEALAATGFLRHGIYEYNQRDARTQWQDMLNDITDTVGDVFLGVGMGCARCHDHKFDPILQKDYFRLQAFFANVAFREDVPIATPKQRAEYERRMTEWEAATREIREQIDALEAPRLESLERSAVEAFPEEIQEIYYRPDSERDSLEKQLAYLVHRQVLDKQNALASRFKDEAKEEWERLKKELVAFDDLKPEPLPLGQTVTDYGAEAPSIYIPSKPRLGEILPGFLTIFDASVANIVDLPTQATTGRRTTLAQWLTRDDHPLTTRVIVNRIWKEHFGNGIVATTSDFGHLGEEPSHPELLDWLAQQFVAHGWSLKWLHREVVTSATYRQQSLREDPRAERIDPENRLLWRSHVRRLNAEQIRDSLLAATGELDLKGGGPPQDATNSRRRSIYTRVMRNRPDPLLSVFDFPDRMASTGDRNTTTTPGQSLLLFNGEWMLQRAEALATQVDKRISGSAESQVREAFRLVLGRDPTESELTRFTEFLETAPTESPPPFTVSEMPHAGSPAAEIGADPEQPPLQTRNAELHLGPRFTIEAVVTLRSFYPNSTVRTIVSDWNNQNGSPGWSLGVTSTKSKYKPGNLILQLVGSNASGKTTYEVVPSDIRLERDQPYFVAVSVDLSRRGEEGIRFVVKDLKSGDVRTAAAGHEVVDLGQTAGTIILGGRRKSEQHRWDGWIGELRISGRSLAVEELTGERERSDADLLAFWQFDPAAPRTGSAGQSALEPVGTTGAVPAPFLDLCHVLLNSNEFVYID